MLKRIAVLLLLALWAAPASADDAAPADSRPKVTQPHNCISFYPLEAVRAGAEGVTRVAFTITADGSVKNPKVEKSAGNSDLDAAALQCVSSWRYVPAKRGGVAVEAPWQANVQWKMHGGSDYRLMAHCAHLYPPTSAMVAKISAVTVLTYRVMPNGAVKDVAVANSSGNSDLDGAATRCIGEGRFNVEQLDIPDTGIPGHALIDWRSEYLRGIPLKPPFPPGLAQPVLIPGRPCESMTHTTKPDRDGETAVEFTIATDGDVRDVTVTQNSGTPALDDAVKTCVAGWRFNPANDSGVPYAVRWSFKVLWHVGKPPEGVQQL